MFLFLLIFIFFPLTFFFFYTKSYIDIERKTFLKLLAHFIFNTVALFFPHSRIPNQIKCNPSSANFPDTSLFILWIHPYTQPTDKHCFWSINNHIIEYCCISNEALIYQASVNSLILCLSNADISEFKHIQASVSARSVCIPLRLRFQYGSISTQ